MMPTATPTSGPSTRVPLRERDRFHPYTTASSSSSSSSSQTLRPKFSSSSPQQQQQQLEEGTTNMPPSPPQSRREDSETPSSFLGLGVAFGAAGSGKWWDEELPPPPASLGSILDSFRRSGEGDRELLLSILGAKKAEEERLTALIQTRLTVLQARLSLHSAAASMAAAPERTPSLTSSGSSAVDSPPPPTSNMFMPPPPPPPPPPSFEKDYLHLAHPRAHGQGRTSPSSEKENHHAYPHTQPEKETHHSYPHTQPQKEYVHLPHPHINAHTHSYRGSSPLANEVPRQMTGRYFHLAADKSGSTSPKRGVSSRDRRGLEMLLDAGMSEERGRREERVEDVA
ncbi:hypothetical protein BCR39DRAFT_549051 [Naematelia encephala]|uniref:Uncharacterized protein n=1 Tax=Naematelia encephala TaxID=71784 RepID=A0A1Y2AN37_9TREE|nr:hypothetical protein BCR39DRAFT_549051 [Naematelia encephala]